MRTLMVVLMVLAASCGEMADEAPTTDPVCEAGETADERNDAMSDVPKGSCHVCDTECEGPTGYWYATDGDLKWLERPDSYCPSVQHMRFGDRECGRW